MLFICLAIYMLVFFISIKKINVKPINDSFLNKDFTTQIRGLAIFAILVSHLINMLYFSRQSNISIIKFIFCVFAPVGVGLFFFLSGYGNTFSIKKQSNIQWLGKRILRIFITILPVLLCQYVLSLLLSLNLFTQTSLVNSFLTLTIPPFTMWYLKVQTFAYILLFLCYKIFNQKFYNVLLAITAIYTIYCIATGVAGMWWVSTMCFPIGVLCEKYKDKILFNQSLNPIKITIFLSVISVIFFILIIPLKAIATFWLCIISCLLMSIMSLLITLNSKILTFLGVHSLEIYCVHLALISILEKINLSIHYANNYKMLIVLILTMLIVPPLKNFCDMIERKLLRYKC